MAAMIRRSRDCGSRPLGRTTEEATRVGPYTRPMTWNPGSGLRNLWSGYSNLNSALSIPAAIALLTGLIAAAFAFVSGNLEWAISLILALALLVIAGMWWLERRRRLKAEDAGRGSAPSPSSITIEPRVERDQAYGRQGNGSAFLVVARIKSADGNVHNEATGVLAAIEPLEDGIRAWYKARDSPQPGLLRWSSSYGGHETARITPTGVDLLVMVFEGTDEAGDIAYFDSTLQAHSESIYLTVTWRITIEVTAADGARAQYRFDLSRGERDPSHPLKIPASPQGTLYPPKVTPLPEKEAGA